MTTLMKRSKTQRFYVAGPMTGYEGYNFPAFYALEAQLVDIGYEVVNPARLDEDGLPEGVPQAAFDAEETGDYRHLFLRRDFREVVHCDGVVLLPGWEASKGANAELAIARFMGLEVLVAEPGPGGYLLEPLVPVFPDWALLDEYATDVFVTIAKEAIQNDIDGIAQG